MKNIQHVQNMHFGKNTTNGGNPPSDKSIVNNISFVALLLFTNIV
jgi:hypothetical protein